MELLVTGCRRFSASPVVL
uniref:Uncharacterized protein n=1 Tax=Arundo donax TaxID=35708 RepID=A0A0A9EMY2_ARUDO